MLVVEGSSRHIIGSGSSYWYVLYSILLIALGYGPKETPI